MCRGEARCLLLHRAALYHSVAFFALHAPRATYHLRVAVKSSQVQRGASVFIGVVGGSPVLHQGTHHGQVALQASPAERRQTLLVHQRDGGTWKNKRQVTWELCH